MEKRKKEGIACYSGFGTILIKNVIRRGMDSSKFINMIMCYPDPDQYRMEDCPVPPNMFYIHDLTFSEALGVLVNEFGVKADEAKKRIKKWISKYHIQRISVNEVPSEYEKIVKEANEEVVKKFDTDYIIGDKDIKIIAGFKKKGINIVHVKDKGFENTCKILGMNVIPTPRRDIEKEKKLKERLRK